MSDSTLWVFLISSVVLITSPGQDMVLVISRSLSRGAKAGVITAAGVSTGLLGHTLLVALGLGALLQTSEVAFTVMKLVGAAYLLYLGIKAFRAPPIVIEQSNGSQESLPRLFAQGAISNISNPKIAIFYFAYLPQFVSADNSNPAATLLALGATFAALTFVIKVPIGYLAGGLSSWVLQRPSVQVWMNRISGTVLVGMAVKLATDKAQ